jgi:hypothetical protein
MLPRPHGAHPPLLHERTYSKIKKIPLKSRDRSRTRHTAAVLTICFRTDFIQADGPQEGLQKWLQSAAHALRTRRLF